MDIVINLHPDALYGIVAAFWAMLALKIVSGVLR